MVTSITLTREELIRRADAIRLVLTDCDGVLTDGGVYYANSGEALKRFSVRDGMGVERLRKAGVATAILTGENSECVERRSIKLRLPHYFPGVKDKLGKLETILQETGFQPHELAFIGDDVNDLRLLQSMGETGLTGAPRDAMQSVLDTVHHVCRARGGYGAFREFAEWILEWRASARTPER